MQFSSEFKRCAEKSIRASLPVLREVEKNIAKIPRYTYNIDQRNGRVTYIEESQPNWWQVPTRFWQKIYQFDETQQFIEEVKKNHNLENLIGKGITIQERGRGERHDDPWDLCHQIIVSYLFRTKGSTWNCKHLGEVFHDLGDYYDIANNKIAYTIYAPIWGIDKISDRLSLDDDLQILHLSPRAVAGIASLNEFLAGVTLSHRITLWSQHFLVRQIDFKKIISADRPNPPPRALDCTSWVNDEVVMMRCFLSEHISVPTYQFVRHGYPRDTGGGSLNLLPWKPSWEWFDSSLTVARLREYAKNRKAFRSLSKIDGWAEIAASMRRFAIAWENPFPADALADIVAALEKLFVGDNQEVGYKLRVRASNFISKTQQERRKISSDIRDAYAYRSRVAHGDFVFDKLSELETAVALNKAKGKKGNPLHDINEISRLKKELSCYYRYSIVKMIKDNRFKIDWESKGI